MRIYTIGFAKKTAAQFFDSLRQPDLLRVIDARLNNSSQLSGFTKKNDLGFFLRVICGIEYFHLPELAPTKDILTNYKSSGDWKTYEKQFLQLMVDRRVEINIDKELIDGSCILCSEATPDNCHRRLVVEYFRDRWGQVEVLHI